MDKLTKLIADYDLNKISFTEFYSALKHPNLSVKECRESILEQARNKKPNHIEEK